MKELNVPVEGAERMLSVFEAWPSFHDAEVIAMDLWRGDICQDRDSWITPTLTAKIQLPTQFGALNAAVDILVTLRFHDLSDLRLADFNHQNAILDLIMQQESLVQGATPSIYVKFVQAFGVDASFRCGRVEVVDAEPLARIPAVA